ncbi:MAG: hypothetical protein GY716_00880 [bacterium]|nr:hypothetical protein [bacterium]
METPTPSSPPRHRRLALARTALAFGALAATLLLLELVVFRFVWPAAALPLVGFVDGVVRYRPNQHGTYRVRDEISAEFRINAQGWNSRHPSYSSERRSDGMRVAIVGDSFVAALQVPYGDSLAERLEDRLGGGAEVYRFGVAGAPLSQHLHVLRNEVPRYAPDLVAVVVVHNDVAESWRFVPGTHTSSFLKFVVEDGVVRGEIAPTPYAAPWFDLVRRSASWRFLVHRQGVRLQTLRDNVLGTDDDGRDRAHIDMSRLDDDRRNDRAVADYAMNAMARAARRAGTDLLIVMDGDRRGIERGSSGSSRALKLNRIVGDAARRHGVEFVDLHPVFAEDRARRGGPLVFRNDGHWTRHAHDVAAGAILSHIRSSAVSEPAPDRGGSSHDDP